METKKWYQSKAIWGGIVAISSGVLGLFGVHVSPETQDFLVDQIVDISPAVASVIGGALAVYGRIKADKRVEL